MRAVQLQPNDEAAILGLGNVFLGMNKPEEAAKYFQRANQLDPSNEVVHYRLSLLYRHMGKDCEAKREMLEFHRLKSMKNEMERNYRSMHLRAPLAAEVAPDR
jgi:predicted Zn-dependent protease